MRKWEEKRGIKRKKITGLKLCNPVNLNVHEA